MAVVYFALAIICRFFFYHHPRHVDVIVDPQRHGSSATNDQGFFYDVMQTRIGQQYGISATQYSRYKHSVSLFDVYRVRE